MSSNELLELTNDEFPSSELPVVLVADDDPITLAIVKRSLQQKGHRVLTAPDGRAAWELFQREEPPLVITDWRMPLMDGFEFCKRIRGYQGTNYTYVIILTSHRDREAMAQGFGAGADDFVTKPFDQAELKWRLSTGMRVLRLQGALETRIKEVDEARKKLDEANQQMQAGLNAAAKSQRAMLPSEPPKVRNVHCGWAYEPCEHLGGDSLNLFQLSDDRIGFFLADVCGHGIASALLAVSLHRVLSPATGQAGLLASGVDDPLELFADPGRVLTEVNRRFPMRIEDGEYFTAVYGVIDAITGQLTLSGAGHPYPFIVARDQSVRKLPTDGFPIGFDEDTTYENQIVTLRPEDRLYVYSDGMIETANPQGEMFGSERFVQWLQESAGIPIETVLQSAVANLEVWAGSPRQQDDLSLIALEFAGATVRSDPVNA